MQPGSGRAIAAGIVGTVVGAGGGAPPPPPPVGTAAGGWPEDLGVLDGAGCGAGATGVPADSGGGTGAIVAAAGGASARCSTCIGTGAGAGASASIGAGVPAEPLPVIPQEFNISTPDTTNAYADQPGRFSVAVTTDSAVAETRRSWIRTTNIAYCCSLIISPPRRRAASQHGPAEPYASHRQYHSLGAHHRTDHSCAAAIALALAAFPAPLPRRDRW